MTESSNVSIGGLKTPGASAQEPFPLAGLMGSRLRGTWTGHEFEVDRVLSGGMGAILVCRYRGWEPFDGARGQWCTNTVPRDVIALKILRDIGAADEKSLAEEIRTVTEIAGASGRIVPIVGVERFEGLGFAMAMPYFPMGSLRQVMVSTQHDVGTRFGIWLQLVMALSEVTQRFPGFVHVDIKPENVLLDRVDSDSGAWLALLSDLGLSRTGDGPGKPRGTPAYMSPEAWAQPLELTPAADVFSLGVVLHELLTGKLPFKFAPAMTRPDYSRRIVAWRADKGVPGWLRQLTDHCLAVSSRERPSYAEIIENVRPHVRAGVGDPAPDGFVYSVSALREFVEGTKFEFSLKHDAVHAELARDLSFLVASGHYDAALARTRALLYDSAESPLFDALRATDSDLFGQGFQTKRDGSSLELVSPAHQSLVKAADLYATAFLHRHSTGPIDVGGLIPDLLPGLALSEIFIRGIQRVLRGEDLPDAWLGSLGNLQLFYRTAYAGFLAMFPATEIEWIRQRWQVIEAACRRFYAQATSQQKQTFDNIFAERGTNGKLIEGVAAMGEKLSPSRLLAELGARSGTFRRMEELSFVVCHRWDLLSEALAAYAQRGAVLIPTNWLRALCARLLQDCIWNPRRLLAPMGREDLRVVQQLEGTGYVGRLEAGAGRLWLVRGMPEYRKGEGLDEIDLVTLERRSLTSLFPNPNILCCRFDGHFLWVGTGDGIYQLELATWKVTTIARLGKPVFEIALCWAGGLWLGSVGEVHWLGPNGQNKTIPVPIAEVHRLVETATLLFCGGDSSGGLCAIDKDRLAARTSPMSFAGYVRDLYAAPGFVGIVGNDHIVVDADTSEHLGGFEVHGELLLSSRLHGDFLAVGGVEGLQLTSRALGKCSYDLGTTTALCGSGGALFVAAGGDLFSVETSY